MALNLSKFNFFSRLDARARVFVLFGGILGVIFLIYIGTRFLSGGETTVGPSRVASAPQGLQSVPGGELTPEYYRALRQANVQAAQQAKISGGSAINTMINPGGQGAAPGPCNIICSDESANVKNMMDDWVRQGNLTPEIAEMLQSLADRNVGVEEYAALLDRLVRDGKISPDQARELLEEYKKQHTNKLLQDSAKMMDERIKAGQLPLDAANELLEAQKNHESPSDYAARLQRMVKEGKISPALAQQLLAQYTQQFAREVTNKSIAILQKMGADGQIIPEVLKQLIELENQMVPLSRVATILEQYVTAGKLTPAVSAKILDEYRAQKAEIGPNGVINRIIQAAEQVGDAARVAQLKTMQGQLAEVHANNAPPADYAEVLKKYVAARTITPDEAAELMQEYQNMTLRVAPITTTTTARTAEFARLQQREQQAPVAPPPTVSATEFQVAETQVQVENDQARQARIQALMGAMSAQAQQLVTSWQPPVMVHRSGAAETKADQASASSTTTTTTKSGTTGGLTDEAGPVLIKAGSVLFAVLDTAVNSDYPDSPVMATIVDGKFKGAKLLGKLTTTKGVSGQMDRVSLNFSLMNMDEWAKSKAVTAYAIDPDTARTVLATDVNYHYLQRFGAIMATSFVQGYANAINSSASTTTTGIFGTTTTRPELSPSQKLASAIGQIGQSLSTVTQNYTNIPPTVKVDSGVSLGILFMSDIS